MVQQMSWALLLNERSSHGLQDGFLTKSHAYSLHFIQCEIIRQWSVTNLKVKTDIRLSIALKQNLCTSDAPNRHIICETAIICNRNHLRSKSTSSISGWTNFWTSFSTWTFNTLRLCHEVTGGLSLSLSPVRCGCKGKISRLTGCTVSY